MATQSRLVVVPPDLSGKSGPSGLSAPKALSRATQRAQGEERFALLGGLVCGDLQIDLPKRDGDVAHFG